MPVVLNLARLPESLLAACEASVETLDDVCSFRALIPSDYLDLDWSPYLLEQTAVTSAAPAHLVDLLREATDGSGEVNPAYRDASHTVTEHPVSSLAPERVAAVSDGLEVLADLGFISDAHVGATLDRLLDWQGLDNPVLYLEGHFGALRAFYRAAAEDRMAVVAWWD